jgi:NAD(P)-dependent dehydrogenase (short-subunit alcohol dehydrogenase family)
MGGEALAIVCDVTNAKETQDAVEQTEQSFGRLDVLVKNAGVLGVSTVETIAEDDWGRVMQTDLKGPFLMSRAALPAMRRAGGCIVNVSSVLGLVAIRDRAAYCASKGGVTLLTKAMALDHDDSSDVRNTASSATSSGLPNLPNGSVATRASCAFSACSLPERISRTSGVSTTDGHIQFTRIFSPGG